MTRIGRTSSLFLALASAAAGGGAGCAAAGGAGASPELPPYRITGKPTLGPLQLHRIELTFSGGRGEATVRRGAEDLSAQAVVGFRGSGPFLASWAVDGRALEPVSILLSAGDTLTLRTSPATQLPTFEPGAHAVTLEIQQPAGAIAAPTIRYTVTVDEEPARGGGKP